MRFPNFSEDPRRDSDLLLPTALAQEFARKAVAERAAAEIAAACKVDAVPPAPSPTQGTAEPPHLREPLRDDDEPLVELVSEEALIKVYRLNATQGPRDRAGREFTQRLLAQLFDFGTLRRAWLPAGRSGLTKLREAHPNFLEVLDFLDAEFALAEASRKPARLPAIILDGPPGCGKTFFAEALANYLATGFLRVSLESGQNAAELTGTAAHWSNAAPGRLFDLMVNGKFANPVVLLDEVDKSGGQSEHRIDRALYALLEPESAKAWCDACFPLLPLDLRHVIWVLTSNTLGDVPRPLLSRMRVFHIAAPTRAEALVMARRIFAKVAAEYQDIGLDQDLPVALASTLALYYPRAMQRFCRAMIANAVKDGRRQVNPTDLAASGAYKLALEVLDGMGHHASDTRH